MRAETDEGVVVVGFRTASNTARQKNEKIRQWMLLNVAMTTKGGHKATIHRGDIELSTPDGKKLPLIDEKTYLEHRGTINAVEKRDNMFHDSIDFLPPGADQVCLMGFFADPSNAVTGRPPATTAWDRVELDPARACMGRLFFRIPEGISFGEYLLMVRFSEGTVQVPFRIMSKEEEKEERRKRRETGDYAG